MSIEQNKKIKIALDVMEQIKANNPRIGGSCCLYVFGLKDDFRDVDIIVDNLNGIDLPYEKIPLIHEKRLNRTLKYMIDNVEIDISESLFYENDVINYIGINFEPSERVIKARDLIDKFIEENYS